jgi:hypothetical protein
MNIKNYTSTVEAARSMSKIEEQLVEIGANNINKQYSNKICTGITFFLPSSFGGDGGGLQQTLPFHLKAQVEECFNILWQDVKRPRPETRAAIQQQASRTAWKILSDWTEVQCTMKHCLIK